VSDDKAPLGNRGSQQVHVRDALPSIFHDIRDNESRLAQKADHIGIDVLIGEQPEAPQFQAETSEESMTSLRTAAAA
jgi:hypothetical protein